MAKTNQKSKKGKKDLKKVLTERQRWWYHNKVVSEMTTLKEPNLKKIEKKVLTRSWWRGNI